MLTKTILLAIMATTLTQGHMIMKTPTPFSKSLNNSPLAADGSDFPCKQRGADTYSGASDINNEWPIGSTQTLSFTGTAVHGGGSCQISLSTDLAPTKSSKFFVIHSIIGGCPTNTTTGNLPDGSNDGSTFGFTVPDGVAPGTYTMAWTWFNRVGNREMYMNCAPVTVTSGKTKKRAVEARKAAARSMLKRATFPDMFVANIGNGCGTSESSDLEFPNPGDSVEKDSADGKTAPPTGTCAGGSGSAGTPSSGSGSAPVVPSSAPSSSSSATSVAAPSVSPSSNAVPPPPAVATTTLVPQVSTSAAAIVSTSAVAAPPQPATGSTGSSASSSGALTGACTTGMWNCFNGGQSFQQCGSGVWSVAQPAAAGNPCKVGTGASAPW